MNGILGYFHASYLLALTLVKFVLVQRALLGQQALSERANTHFERFGGVPLGRFLLSKTSNHG